MNSAISASVCFAVSEFSATIQVQATNADSVILTVIHESMVDNHIQAIDLIGSEGSDAISVYDGESLIFIARMGGDIVATGVFQITSLEGIGHALMPCAVSNMIINKEATREKAQVL